ncbi:PGF-pre-PGF domain-containing protein, partial [Nanoarchaeota archaeon]
MIIIILSILSLSATSVLGDVNFVGTSSHSSFDICACGNFLDDIQVINFNDQADAYYIEIEGDAAKWITSFPSELVVSANGDGMFKNFITAPCDKRGEYSFSTIIENSKGVRKKFTQDINVKACSNVEVYTSVAESACQCEPISYLFKIKNIGDYTDRFVFSLDKYNDYAKYSEEEVELMPGEEKKVYLFIKLPCDIYGKLNVELNVESVNSNIITTTPIEMGFDDCGVIDVEEEDEEEKKDDVKEKGLFDYLIYVLIAVGIILLIVIIIIVIRLLGEGQKEGEYRWVLVGKDEEAKAEIQDEKSAISEITFKANTNIENCALSTKSRKFKPYNIKEKPGHYVYQYNKIDKENLDKNDMKDIVVKFKITRKWLEENNLTQNNITLKRFNGEIWEIIETRRVNSDENYVYYKSNLKDFSYFAITERDYVEPPEKKKVDKKEVKQAPVLVKEVKKEKPIVEKTPVLKPKKEKIEKKKDDDKKSNVWWWILLIVAILLLGGLAFFLINQGGPISGDNATIIDNKTGVIDDITLREMTLVDVDYKQFDNTLSCGDRELINLDITNLKNNNQKLSMEIEGLEGLKVYPDALLLNVNDSDPIKILSSVNCDNTGSYDISLMIKNNNN